MEVYLENSKDIAIVILSFVGTILAIFFTLIALPVQNILGRYSQDFVKKVLFDKLILGCFIFLSLIFLYNFTLLLYNPVPITASLSIISAYFSVITLLILVYRVFYFLDIRNQIKKVSKNIQIKILSSKIENFNWLSDELDYIFDVSLRAIQMDRYEYFQYSMKELYSITQKYMNIYKNTSSYNNWYFMHITQRLTDIKNSITISNHPKMMEELVKCLGGIGKESLLFTMHDKFTKYDFSTHLVIDNLKEIILSAEMLKGTSTAPYSALNEIKNIGIESIKAKYIGTTTNIIESLGSISRLTNRLHFNYGNYISVRSNNVLIFLVTNLFEGIKTLEGNDDVQLKTSLEVINETINDFFNDEFEHSYNTNISPFYYPLAENGFMKLLVNLLNKILSSKDEHFCLELLKITSEFLASLNQNVMLAMKKQYYTEVKFILSQTYAFTIAMLIFKRKENRSKIISKVNGLLERYIYYIFHNPIYSSFESKNGKSAQYYDYIDMYISVLGILFIEYSTFPELLPIIVKWVNGIISIIEKHKENFKHEELGEIRIKYEILHPLRELYYSLKIVGFWSYAYGDKILIEKIKEILKSQPKETKEYTSWGSEEKITGIVGMQYVIVDSRGDKKRLHTPYLTFSDLLDMNKKLFDVEKFEEYEKFLES